MCEALKTHFELVRIEADGNVELEAGGDDGTLSGDVLGREGEKAGGGIDRDGSADIDRSSVDSDEKGTVDGLYDATQIVAGADVLNGGATTVRAQSRSASRVERRRPRRRRRRAAGRVQ